MIGRAVVVRATQRAASGALALALLAVASCGPPGLNFLTTEDMRGKAGASLHLLGDASGPVHLYAMLDMPDTANRMPDGRCWTSSILATANGIPMETIHQGIQVGGPHDSCRGGWYRLVVADHPELAETDELTIRFYDDAGTLEVQVYRFFDAPTARALNSPTAGGEAVVEVLPSPAALGPHFYLVFSAQYTPVVFGLGEGFVIEEDRIRFPVPPDVAPAVGWLYLVPEDTAGAFFARIDDCADFLDCRAIRGACAGVTCDLRIYPEIDRGYDGPIIVPFEVQ